LLPLSKQAGTIAVIGPLADDADAPLGNWRGRAVEGPAVTLLAGVRAAVGPEVEVRYARGAALTVGEPGGFSSSVSFNEDDRSGFPAAIEAATGADVVLLAIGEMAYQSGEARSQVDIGFKGVQLDLLRAVRGVNERIVVVLMNGRPLVLTEVDAAVPAILETWLAGSQAGHAIADVLFGDHSPSGKLPVSFPRHLGQLPLYYNAKNTGRPHAGDFFTTRYTDCPNVPLFPFGFGLGYTSFEYSEPRLSAALIDRGETLRIAVDVKNVGQRRGTEVVQLYLRDLVGSLTRPVRQLKGFEKAELAPGESREIRFELGEAELAFHTATGRWESEPGTFEVFVGGSSDTTNGARFELR
jgi:beta-glucosidase